MIRLLALIACSCVPGLAVATCEELKARIAEGLTAKGVSGFQLDIVAIDQADTGTVVGRCEERTKKILYSRAFAPTAPASTVAPPRAAPAAASSASSAPTATVAMRPSVAAVPPPAVEPAASAPPVAVPASKPSVAAVAAPAAGSKTSSAPSAAATSKPSATPAAARALSKAGGSLRDTLGEGGEGPLMVVIPAGEFMMGSSQPSLDRRYSEGPEHPVKVAAFALARTEITYDDYDRFARATSRRLPDDAGQGRGSRPVVDVSWVDAAAYSQWLTAQTGFTYRLPSEAEWEYAARAGTKPGAPYGTGDCISARQANFNDATVQFNNCPSSGINVGRAQPVASYAANAYGVFDMHGNVFEWTADCVHLSYTDAPSDGSAWLQDAGGKCSERMVRGGSWQSGQIAVRAALRAAIGYGDSSGLIGFRVVRVLQP